MRGRVLAAVLGVAAVAAAIVVATSSAGGGGGKGPYRFFSGPVFTHSSGAVRVDVANLSGAPRDVTVIFSCDNVPEEPNSQEVPPNGSAVFIGANGGCEARVQVRSKSALIAPTVAFPDSTDAERQHIHPGDLVVVRDGKRVW